MFCNKIKRKLKMCKLCINKATIYYKTFIQECYYTFLVQAYNFCLHECKLFIYPVMFYFRNIACIGIALLTIFLWHGVATASSYMSLIKA